jgi:hypothetical protein
MGLRFEERKSKFGGFEMCENSSMYPIYNAAEDTLNCYDKENGVFEAIYRHGVWATLIPAKKTFPKTKEELSDFLGDYQSFSLNGGEEPSDFLNQYED